MSEPPRSPAPPGGGCVGLLAQFSSAVQKQRWPQAIALSEQILKMEPDNEMVLQFQPLLEQADAKRLKKGEFHDGSSSSSDEEDGDDGDNGDDSDGDGAGAAATGGGGGAGGAVTMGTVVSEEKQQHTPYEQDAGGDAAALADAAARLVEQKLSLAEEDDDEAFARNVKGGEFKGGDRFDG